jgi:hypothetical protein
MAAPLNTCTTIAQRGVERFLWAKKYGFAEGFQGLVKWWDKCLNLYGAYIEK